MIRYFLTNMDSMDVVGILCMMFSYAVILLLTLPVHEFAHGYVAHLCGDDTAKWHGRLSLNPFRHLDLWGSIMILTIGIGYAKPVPVNTRNLRNYKRDTLLVSLAGPLSNLLMAYVAVLIFRICYIFVDNAEVLFWLWMALVNIIASVNISLMVFNLLPIPPLDGSRLWSRLLPAKWGYALERYSHYIAIGLFVAVFAGLLDGPLSFLHNGVGALIGYGVGLPGVFNPYNLFTFG
ncbi:MAG: site-2 protease family protein [Clostridia bacterium]|nr:site-2 protease family protein [Clostridia bacterium]